MKKVLALMTAVVVASVFMSCASKQAETTQNGVKYPVKKVSVFDGFDDEGFYEIECMGDGTLCFQANQDSISAGVKWIFYRLGEQFLGDKKNISQNNKLKGFGDISESGEVKVVAGDYIYIWCSENKNTLSSPEEATEGAYIAYYFED